PAEKELKKQDSLEDLAELLEKDDEDELVQAVFISYGSFSNPSDSDNDSHVIMPNNTSVRKTSRREICDDAYVFDSA
ncbi:hypothetical protein KEM55_005344, partial [Ascosphaera atra]